MFTIDCVVTDKFNGAIARNILKFGSAFVYTIFGKKLVVTPVSKGIIFKHKIC